jgi:hypothetical protein
VVNKSKTKRESTCHFGEIRKSISFPVDELVILDDSDVALLLVMNGSSVKLRPTYDFDRNRISLGAPFANEFVVAQDVDVSL